MNWIMVIAGAIVGAPLRYLIDRVVQKRFEGVFPWGTLVVNLIACTGLGFLAGAAAAVAVPANLQYLLGPGLCATLSTYSTFTFETTRLGATGFRLAACVNILASVTAGLGAAFLGSALAHALWA